MNMLKFTTLMFAGLAAAKPAEDKFEYLDENAYPMSTDSYSGYLDVSANKSLHYILVESKNDPATDPVIMWFNGGPGCSSMLGFMQENGPWIIDDFETDVKENPYPWNAQANVLYLEAPAGVGFSIGRDDNAKTHNDMSSSMDNFKALQLFYQKFPEFLSNELYITGESYAGLYVPYLTWQVYQNNLRAKFDNKTQAYNIKGFAVGNGATDWQQDGEPVYPWTFANFELLPPSFMDKYTSLGCEYYHADIWPMKGPQDKCDELFNQMFNQIDSLNIYDLYRYKLPSETPSRVLKASSPDRIGKTMVDGEERTYKRGYTQAEYTPWLKHHPIVKNNEVVYGDVVSDFLNKQSVRNQLHIPAEAPAWEECSGFVFDKWQWQKEASRWIYKVLRGSGIKMMHYSGDTDGAVPTAGTKRWIKLLNFPVIQNWAPWYTDGQVSGYIEKYDGLDFVTIKGVGHMAPQWARKPVQKMIYSFISGRPLVD